MTGLIQKILHPVKASEETATSGDSLHDPDTSGQVKEFPAELRVMGNPHHGNKHDKHPVPNSDDHEGPIGFGKPGYPEGNPGLGAAGAGAMSMI